MVIVQKATSISTPSEDIKTNQLKPYQANGSGPYVTAFIKTGDLPLIFVIGDGKEYNSDVQKYVNQPLQQNSSYIVFLRFFQSEVRQIEIYHWNNKIIKKIVIKNSLNQDRRGDESKLSTIFSPRNRTTRQNGAAVLQSSQNLKVNSQCMSNTVYIHCTVPQSQSRQINKVKCVGSMRREISCRYDRIAGKSSLDCDLQYENKLTNKCAIYHSRLYNSLLATLLFSTVVSF